MIWSKIYRVFPFVGKYIVQKNGHNENVYVHDYEKQKNGRKLINTRISDLMIDPACTYSSINLR